MAFIDDVSRTVAAKPRFVAADVQIRRLILAAGSDCIAIDIAARVSQIENGTAPVPLSILKKVPKPVNKGKST